MYGRHITSNASTSTTNTNTSLWRLVRDVSIKHARNELKIFKKLTMQVEPDSKKPHYRTAVKFRKINKDTLARLQTKGDNDENQRSAELHKLEEESEDDGEEETRPELTLAGTPFTEESWARDAMPRYVFILFLLY